MRVTVTNSVSKDYGWGDSSPDYLSVKTRLEVFLTNPSTGEEELISEDETSDSVNVS